MDSKKSIEALQFFITGLSRGAFVHMVQGKDFKSQGFEKLGDKYIEHYNEEMGWVDKFIDRLIDLGGEVKVEDNKGDQIVCDPVEYIKVDLDIQVAGVDMLRKCMASICEDVTTFDIMKEYLKDEEEDLYWSQGQLELIEMIGKQNWLIRQM